MNLKIYTDASYSMEHKIAACGYVLIEGRRKVLSHKVCLVENVKCNNHAEIFAAYLSLHDAINLKGIKRINLLTDNYCVIMAINNLGDVTGVKHPEYYTELIEVLEIFNMCNIVVKAIKVKAHSDNENNNKVDISARTELRKHLNSTIK